MSLYLAKHAASLMARDIAADDSHAMRDHGDYAGGRNGRGHLQDFIDACTPVSPDVQDSKIATTADVRAHIMAMACHPSTIAFYAVESKTVLLCNPQTKTFVVHTGKPRDLGEGGYANLDGGSVYPLWGKRGAVTQVLLKLEADVPALKGLDHGALGMLFDEAVASRDMAVIQDARAQIEKTLLEKAAGKLVVAMNGGLETLGAKAPEAIAALIDRHNAIPAEKAAVIAKTAPFIDPLFEAFTADVSDNIRHVDRARALLNDLSGLRNKTQTEHSLAAQKSGESPEDASLRSRASDAKQRFGEVRADTDALKDAVTAGTEAQRKNRTLFDALVKAHGERADAETLASGRKELDGEMADFAAKARQLRDMTESLSRKHGLEIKSRARDVPLLNSRNGAKQAAKNG